MSGFTLQIVESDIDLELSQSPAIVLELGLSVPIVQTVSSGGGGGSDGVEIAFTNGDLSVAGILVVTHGLNLTPSGIAVYDSVGEWIYPDKIEALTDTMAAINLESFRPLQGNWRVKING
jgi:hypothetical protein